MANFRVSLACIFGVVSLIISLGLVNQVEPMAAQLPSPTPTATPLPKPEPFPGAARLVRCQDMSQPRFFFYRPTLTPDVPQRLIISGTIYAADLTPLSDTIIEIWRTEPEQMKNPYPRPTRLLLSTDEAGHYQFTAIKPARPEQAYLHLKLVYQDHCPLLLHLRLVTESRSKLVRQPTFAKVVAVNGPVLQGPLDIVMPVPPAP